MVQLEVHSVRWSGHIYYTVDSVLSCYSADREVVGMILHYAQGVDECRCARAKLMVCESNAGGMRVWNRMYARGHESGDVHVGCLDRVQVQGVRFMQ